MEIVVTNQYGLIIFAVTVDENGMPKTLYHGINRAEAVSTYQKAIENPANAKKRVRFYNFRQVYDYVGAEKDKSAYPIKEFYDDTEIYQPSNKDNIETIMVNNNHKLLAPNGKVSNLTAEQWHLVRTPEFKDWFGDWLRHPNKSSKVLDANGEPMVMFHGSNNYQYFTNPYPNYTVFFDPRMSRLEPRTEGGGVYFSNKWDVAAQFSIFNFVVECFINIRKPMKIDGDYSHIWYVIGEERINYGKNDGVILYNTFDTLDGETENENYVSDIVIARYSNQVKLADGRNTTFDKNDVDIRFEDGGKLHSSNIDEANKSPKKHDAEILFDKKLNKYIKSVFLSDDEPIRTWGNMKIGDKITVTNIYRDLPESQADPDMGEYELKVIPIALTDHYINGYVHNRDYFREDDYDNYQTELLNRLKNDFDSNKREPIIAIYNRYGYYTVVDGHHRLVIANELGRKSILALVIDESKNGDSERVSSKLPAYTSYQNAIRFYNRGYQKEIQKDRIDWMQNLLQFKPNNNYEDGGKIDYSKDITVVAALTNSNNEVLILQRGATAGWMPLHWSLVGGMVDEGEDKKKAVLREIKEEIGIDVDDVDYVDTIYTKDAGTIVYYVGKLPDDAEIVLDYENVRYDYINSDTINNYDYVPYVKSFIHKLLFEMYRKNHVVKYNLYSKITGLPTKNVAPTDFVRSMNNLQSFCVANGLANRIFKGSGGYYVLRHDGTLIKAFDTLNNITYEDAYKLLVRNYEHGGKFHLGGNMSKHLAPNRKPSNLTPEQWHLVRTPAFKAWFGDWENNPQEASKVVDSNGEPLVVYRGDASNRHVFNEDTFFSSNDYVAGSYSNEDAVPEYEVFLNIRKPLNLLGGNELRFNPNGSRISGSDPYVVGIFKKAISEMPNDYVVKVGWGDEWDKKTLLNAVIRNHHGIEYIDYNNQSASWEAIIKYAKKQGYDGVFMYDESIDKLIQHQISQIVFHPTQIKLADGSNTTFDGSNPDIRFELGGIYHGSPYRFEKFSTANIGTGESHRSYGWGLYFTEIEEIAKFYANNVSRPILLDKNGNEIKISDELANLIKLGYEKNMMWWDTDYIKEIMGIRAKALGTKWAEDAVKELNQIGYFELVFNRYVYRVTLHKGKTPDQYTWLEWDKPVSAENIIKINKALEKKGIPATPKKYMEVGMDGRVSVGMNGEQVYIELSKIFGDAEFGGDKQASLFLLENGIDGIKYPADKNMAGGFSYVVFDENAVTIENVEHFAKGGKTGNLNYLYKIYDDKDFVSEIENLIEKDGSSFICTYVASAIKMLEGDRAKIYGFSQLENPQSQYFADSGEDEDEGHHFAVVDDRYIVDAWIYNNFSKDGKIFGRSVFDMENPNDQDIIEYIYGNKHNWIDITNRVKNEFEEFFPKSALELKEKYKAYKTRTQFNKGGKVKIKVHSEEGEEDRTTISIPNVGEVIIAETTPEYEFMDDIDEKTMKELGVEEGDLIGKLEWIVVKDEYKGQGYATLLMKKAIEVAKEKDLMPLYLNASPMGFTGMNTEELTAFYEKFGFKVFKRQGHNNLMILKEQKHEKGGKTTARPYSNLDISRVKKGIVQLHSIHPKRITKIDDLPI